MNKQFAEKVNIVHGFQPIDMGSGANAGDWVSLKNHFRCAIILIKEPGDAGNDPVITLLQAKTVAGGSSKALNITRVDKKQAATDLSAVGSYTTSTVQAPAPGDTFNANTWTNSDLAEQSAVVVIDIKAEDLDIDDGFDCIQASIADTGSAGQLGTLFYALHDARHEGGNLSSIVD